MTEADRAEARERWASYLDMIATQAVRRVAAFHERVDLTHADIRAKRIIEAILDGIGATKTDGLALDTETRSDVSDLLRQVEAAIDDLQPRKAAAE